MGGYQKDRATLFLEMHGDWGQEARDKLQHGKFWLDIRGRKFSMNVVKHWIREPEKLSEGSSFLETVKTW